MISMYDAGDGREAGHADTGLAGTVKVLDANWEKTVLVRHAYGWSTLLQAMMRVRYVGEGMRTQDWMAQTRC